MNGPETQGQALARIARSLQGPSPFAQLRSQGGLLRPNIGPTFPSEAPAQLDTSGGFVSSGYFDPYGELGGPGAVSQAALNAGAFGGAGPGDTLQVGPSGGTATPQAGAMMAAPIGTLPGSVIMPGTITNDALSQPAAVAVARIPPGGVGPIANTETQVLAYTIKANTLRLGTAFHIWLRGTFTTGGSPGLLGILIRLGGPSITGTAGISHGNPNGIASQTDQAWSMSGDATFPVVGASAEAIAGQTINLGTATLDEVSTWVNLPATSFDSTVDNLLEVTVISGAAGSSYIMAQGAIEIIVPPS